MNILLFWHAPLGVCSTIHRHQPPRRMVLGQVDCFIQCEVVGPQIALDMIWGRPGGLFQLLGWWRRCQDDSSTPYQVDIKRLQQ